LRESLKTGNLTYPQLLEVEKPGFITFRKELKCTMQAQIAAGEKEHIAATRAIQKIDYFLRIPVKTANFGKSTLT
jgi:hypothetical protein